MALAVHDTRRNEFSQLAILPYPPSHPRAILSTGKRVLLFYLSRSYELETLPAPTFTHASESSKAVSLPCLMISNFTFHLPLYILSVTPLPRTQTSHNQLPIHFTQPYKYIPLSPQAQDSINPNRPLDWRYDVSPLSPAVRMFMTSSFQFPLRVYGGGGRRDLHVYY